MLMAVSPWSLQVSKAIKEAEETCAQTPGAPCAVAWDEVEEISAAAADKKKVASQDPLEVRTASCCAV